MSRPRSIPEKEAIDRALRLFWENGFDRTSIADLGDAIGVGPSSIYNAFGSKQDLFEKALAQYMTTHADFVGELFVNSKNVDTVQFVGQLLSSLVMLYTDPKTPLGCAMMQGGGSGSVSDSRACATTVGMKADLEMILCKFFKAKHAAGEELSAPPKVLAKFIVGSIRGLSQSACDGSTQKELLAVAKLAAESCTSSS